MGEQALVTKPGGPSSIPGTKGAGGITEQVTKFAVKPGDMSSMSRTHMVEE